MSNKQVKMRGWLIFLIVVCATIITCIAVVFVPYNNFVDKAKRATLIMDQLNDNTLKQIPPPEGVTLFESKIMGNRPGQGYGSWLIVTYNKNSMTRSDIYQYYLSILSPAEWKIDGGIGTGMSQIFAVRGTSCFQIRIWDDSVSGQYDITIQQDLKQFVGSIPEDNILFEESITHCP